MQLAQGRAGERFFSDSLGFQTFDTLAGNPKRQTTHNAKKLNAGFARQLSTSDMDCNIDRNSVRLA